MLKITIDTTDATAEELATLDIYIKNDNRISEFTKSFPTVIKQNCKEVGQAPTNEVALSFQSINDFK